MILSHDSKNKKAAEEIQKQCLIKGYRSKIQYSQITGKILYLFEKGYPKGLEGLGIEYEAVKE